jgi:hypothetical protein
MCMRVCAQHTVIASLLVAAKAYCVYTALLQHLVIYVYVLCIRLLNRLLCWQYVTCTQRLVVNDTQYTKHMHSKHKCAYMCEDICI